jgi:tRNA-dihydrouridine synthase 1
LTVHGRTRESKGQLAGLASWPTISSVASLLAPIVPIYANGGLPSGENIEDCLAETGTKGVMSAEGNLYNPMIFSPINAAAGVEYKKCLPEEMKLALEECEKGLLSSSVVPVASTSSTRIVGPAYAPATYLAAQYLSIVLTLPSTETSPSAIKAHIFKLFRPIWATGKHLELREALGKANTRGTRQERHDCYRAVVTAMEEKIKVRSFHPLSI